MTRSSKVFDVAAVIKTQEKEHRSLLNQEKKLRKDLRKAIGYKFKRHIDRIEMILTMVLALKLGCEDELRELALLRVAELPLTGGAG